MPFKFELDNRPVGEPQANAAGEFLALLLNS